MFPYKWPKGADKVGYLTSEQVSERLEVVEGELISTGDFFINYAVAMQRGYYPSDLDKACQDSYLVGSFCSGFSLCVFDGHGPVSDLLRFTLFFHQSVCFQCLSSFIFFFYLDRRQVLSVCERRACQTI